MSSENADNQTTKSEPQAFVEQLISQMSLPEKVGQMTQLTNTSLQIDPDINPDGSPGDTFGLDAERVEELVSTYHVGSFLNGIAIPAEDWIVFMKELQEICIREHRLGIPIIYGIDHMHGASYLEGGTIFPHRSNLGATFTPEFSREEGRIIGLESSHLGHHWVFAPVLDVGRNPRFPRFYETYSEEQLLCGQMGAAFIRGLTEQTSHTAYRQASCAKHFVGYSVPNSGWDRSPATISDLDLYNHFLPPFQAAIEAGVHTFMVNGGDINGVPVHASRRLLTDILRGYLGFSGVVVTDWEDVIRLHTVHKVVESPKEAVRVAIEAGIDISMTPFDTEFCDYLIELVEEGKISERRIDESVARILHLKVDLGLFQQPFPSSENLNKIGLSSSRRVARQAALESIVLLKNKSSLPISPDSGKVIVSGPLANMKRALAGGWTLRWIPDTDRYFPEKMDTVWTALEYQFGERATLVESGTELFATAEDTLVIVVGEEPYSEGSGNNYDARLPEDQVDWVRKAQATGAKVVLLILGGRPQIITEIEAGCDAVIWAGLPGFEGASAIADLISGRENFSGKLPFSYPAQTGHFYTYDHKLMDLGHYQEFQPTKTLLAPFGYGLSYSSFQYSHLSLSADHCSKDETIKAEVTVTNTGEKAGKETVLWFIRDEYASYTPALRKLKHYEKREIQPGESQKYSIEINPSKHLGFFDEHGTEMLEVGEFTLIVDELEAKFTLNS